MHVFDLGLQLAPVLLGDFATEDDRDLVRLADGAVGVEQAFAELVESGSPIKDQVVAEFDVREEQPVLTARLPALCFAEERGEARQPFAAAARQILGGCRRVAGAVRGRCTVTRRSSIARSRCPPRAYGWRASDVG